MRKMFSRALVICAIATVAAFGADNSLGTWKMNPAKSKYTPAPLPLKSYTVTREAAPGGVKVTIAGERNRRHQNQRHLYGEIGRLGNRRRGIRNAV